MVNNNGRDRSRRGRDALKNGCLETTAPSELPYCRPRAEVWAEITINLGNSEVAENCPLKGPENGRGARNYILL